MASGCEWVIYNPSRACECAYRGLYRLPTRTHSPRTRRGHGFIRHLPRQFYVTPTYARPRATQNESKINALESKKELSQSAPEIFPRRDSAPALVS